MRTMYCADIHNWYRMTIDWSDISILVFFFFISIFVQRPSLAQRPCWLAELLFYELSLKKTVCLVRFMAWQHRRPILLSEWRKRHQAGTLFRGANIYVTKYFLFKLRFRACFALTLDHISANGKQRSHTQNSPCDDMRGTFSILKLDVLDFFMSIRDICHPEAHQCLHSKSSRFSNTLDFSWWKVVIGTFIIVSAYT